MFIKNRSYRFYNHIMSFHIEFRKQCRDPSKELLANLVVSKDISSAFDNCTVSDQMYAVYACY